MNEHIKNFVKYEDQNKPHKKMVSCAIALPLLLLPIINMFSYFTMQDVNWLFYSLVPFSFIDIIWGFALLHNLENKRAQYYLFCGITKIYFSLLFSHLILLVIIAFIELHFLFFFFLYVLLIVYATIKAILTKKQIVSRGLKMKSFAPLSFGACCGIGVLCRIFTKSLQKSFGNTIVIIIATICSFYVIVTFINLGINDLLKYHFIKKLEVEEFYDSIENYELDKNF